MSAADKGMTAQSRGLGARSAAPAWFRNPLAVPLGAALLAIALLCGVTWVAAIAATGTIQTDAQEHVRSNRDAAVRALVHQTDDFKTTVATWAGSGPVIDSLRSPSPASLRAVQGRLSILTQGKSSPSACLADLQGRILACYPHQPATIGESYAFRDWFKGVSQTGKPYVSEAFRTSAPGHPLAVGVAAPVLDGSRRVGVVAVSWLLESVRQLSQGARADDGVTITVTDQQGQPLTGTVSVDDRGQALRKPISWATREALAGRSTNTISDGMLQVSGPVPGLGWTVTATLPSSVALAPAHAFQRSLSITLGVALLLVLAFTVLAWRIARRRTAEQTHAAQYARRLIEAGLDPLVTISPDGKVTDVNEATVRITGIQREGLIGTDFSDSFTDPGQANAIYQRVFAEGSVANFPLTMRHRDGSLTEVLYNVSVYPGAGGKMGGVLAVARDMTKERQAARTARSLAAAEDLVSTVLSSASVGIALTSIEGRFRVVNRSLCAFLGYDEAWLLGHRIQDVIHPDDLQDAVERRHRVAAGGETPVVTLRMVRADGRTVWVRRVVVVVPDGDGLPNLLMFQIEDITAEHEAQQALAHQAFHDPLTELHNRAWILDILDVDLAAAIRQGTSVGALFVDLDNFKVVNDSLGHAAGDEVLATVADRIVTALRPGDRVGRFGGDVFVIVIQNVQDIVDLERCAERVSVSIASDLHVRGHRIVPTASIGIAVSTSSSTPDSLLRDADSALSRAKSAGRARWHFFDAAMHAKAVARLTVEDQLRDAIARHEFVVHYQPIVALADAQVIGHEALVRWLHPTRGLLYPGDFLDVAEDTGLITVIGAQVLDQVCKALAERPDLAGPISVNVSAVQLAAPDWLNGVRDAFAAHRVDPARIVIEVTETAVLSLVGSARLALTSLRALGVGIHLDDFGTGYSSISILRDLPVTGVKLDLRFVHDLTVGDSQANALAGGLIGLVNGMQLTGVAEGIETQMQVDILRAQGWKFGQGYFFGRPAPMPPPCLSGLLDRRQGSQSEEAHRPT
jgi:diguanylate cyclase (GGDEF)-like protein/PAS domain S-box-containing protein